MHDGPHVVVGIPEDVLTVVKSSDGRDVVRVQRKVKDVGVLPDAGRVGGLVDAHHAGVQLPAQADLIDALAVLVGDGLQDGAGLRKVGQLPVHEGAVALQLDAAGFAEAAQVMALIVRVALHLVDHGENAKLAVEAV